MALTDIELRSAIEAILFAASEPVAVDNLIALFPDEGKDAVNAQLEEIKKFFEESGRGFTLEVAAGGFRFATRPENDPFLRRFFSKQKEGRLSVAALETLAIVAYRQPVTAPEISDIRGVNSAGVIRTLLERRMIRIAGRKNVVGSPFLYRTTREFLTHFGLSSIQELPRLEEFADILGENIGEELLGTGLDEYAASLEAQGMAEEMAAEHGSRESGAEEDAESPESTEGDPATDREERDEPPPAKPVNVADSNDATARVSRDDEAIPQDSPDKADAESNARMEESDATGDDEEDRG